MAKSLMEKIKDADSFKESIKTFSALSDVCDKLKVSAIDVMKSSGYSYCDRIALETGIPYLTVLPIVWDLWENAR